MPRLKSTDLSDFVAIVDSEYAGDLGDPALAERFYPIELEHTANVDQDLDPFSEEYYNQQIKLYEEISGRKLDQESGELHPVHIESLIDAPNPLGILNPAMIGEHSRAISTMLVLSNVGTGANVLDMGAGHGLSSELLAFCGCAVTAIDIDPELGRLAEMRAAARSLSVRRQRLNYDDLAKLTYNAYDAAFFFQSLHHCLRPWKLVADLHQKLVQGGIIAFTGEPIGTPVWRNWGLRLDQESLYVARKFGWFESGWSHAFIRACFARAGYALTFFSGGHGGGEIAIASADAVKVQAAEIKAASLGYLVRYPVVSPSAT